ncbi:fucose-specific lectin [Astrocystis sublimbata]|nr:fucose-specific lectin [Astrocystis sublimbata]
MPGASPRDGTDVAITATGEYECKVYYQDTEGVVRESIHLVSGWKHTTTPTFKAKPASPLAAISFDSGNAVRVYCVSVDNLLEEYCYSSQQSGWYPGSLAKSRFRVAEASKVAAIYCVHEDNIRVFAQVLPTAQTGSSLAATRWDTTEDRLRVYYLAPDSTVKEHCYEKSQWFAGEFNLGDIAPYASISAAAWCDSNAGRHLRIYVQDPSGKISAYQNDGGWMPMGPVLGPLRPGRRVAALEWKTGAEQRIFYQADDGKIREEAQDEGGAWFQGEYVS